MIRRPSLLSCLLLGVLLTSIGGCKDRSGHAVVVDVIGTPGDAFEGGRRLSPAGQLVRNGTALGLVGFDSEGRVIPALADRWIVTDDGLSYIFRLADGSWSDGSLLTSESARDSLRAALSGLQSTALGADLSGIAEIRAMTGRVVEIRLSHPMPELLDLLAQPELALLKGGKGTGPFRLRRVKDMAELNPVLPGKREAAPVAGYRDGLRPVEVRAMAASAAVIRFDQGSSDLVTGGRFSNYPLALTVAGLSRRALRLDPVSGLFGLVVVDESGLLKEPAVREAVSMAIDRDALAGAISVQGWTGTNRLIPADAPEAPPAVAERWVGVDMAQRKADARRRVAAATRGQPVLRIALPKGPGSDRLFERLSADLRDIGIKASAVASDAPADLRLVDTVARYPRADWYLAQFSCALSRSACSAVADRFALQARTETDPAKRASLLADAETALTRANVFIPLGEPIRWSLVRDPQPGFAANPRGLHPLSDLALRPR